MKATNINSLENLLAVSRIKKTQGLDVDQITCNVDDCLDDELDVSNYLDDDLDDGLVVNCSSPSDEGPFIG